MPTAPTDPAEIDAWITVLFTHGHLHRAEPGPDGSWTVQRARHSRPHTLHHPVLAYDFITEVLADIRQQRAGGAR